MANIYAPMLGDDPLGGHSMLSFAGNDHALLLNTHADLARSSSTGSPTGASLSASDSSSLAAALQAAAAQAAGLPLHGAQDDQQLRQLQAAASAASVLLLGEHHPASAAGAMGAGAHSPHTSGSSLGSFGAHHIMACGTGTGLGMGGSQHLAFLGSFPPSPESDRVAAQSGPLCNPNGSRVLAAAGAQVLPPRAGSCSPTLGAGAAGAGAPQQAPGSPGAAAAAAATAAMLGVAPLASAQHAAAVRMMDRTTSGRARGGSGGGGGDGGTRGEGEPPLTRELGVSISSLARLFTADGRHDFEQPVWMVVNLQVGGRSRAGS